MEKTNRLVLWKMFEGCWNLVAFPSLHMMNEHNLSSGKEFYRTMDIGGNGHFGIGV